MKSDLFNMKASAPFYLIESYETCWKCGKRTSVIALAASGVEDDEKRKFNSFSTLSDVEQIPQRLQTLIDKKYLNYYMDYSKTAESYYFMNHCEHCEAKLGDFFLHCEPDGAFFPTTEAAAKEKKLIELEDAGIIELNASYSMTGPSLIKEYAVRKKYNPSADEKTKDVKNTSEDLD